MEANPQHAEQVTWRLRHYIDIGRLTIVNKAITAEEGPITFYLSDNVSIWGTTERAWAERNRNAGASIREIVVPRLRFADLLSEFGVPYYLKIDIEGEDTTCLAALLEIEYRPKYMSIESSIALFEELVGEFCLFQQLGYKRYKRYKRYRIIPQHQIAKQQLSNPAREGVNVDPTFIEGLSGAFGQELTGGLDRYRGYGVLSEKGIRCCRC